MEKLWRWLVYVCVVLACLLLVPRLHDGLLNGLLSFATGFFLIVGGSWALYGTEGVRARWRAPRQGGAARGSGYSLLILLSGVVVAVALVFAFNLFWRAG